MATIKPYDSAKGKRYRVRYRKPDGRQTDKRGFKTKKEAELFAATVEVSKATGEFIDATAGRATIGELGTTWLKHQTHLKPSTYRSVESAWRNHVNPEWGSRKVATIKPSEISTWMSGKTASGLSATSVLRMHGVLAGILDMAVADRRLARNPARGVKLPEKRGKRRVYLSHEQVGALANSAGKNALVVLTLAYTGLRWGELAGLSVADVNFTTRRLTVHDNAVAVGGEVIVGTAKDNEPRSVPVPKFLLEKLRNQCKNKPRSHLVFGDGVTYLRLPNSKKGWFTYAVKRCQAVDSDFPRVTPHDLRHTAASLAISAGANVKAVQRMLGHASAAMTLDTYADLFDDDLDSVAESLQEKAVAACPQFAHN
ncbi:tyrosine-type recombinase/integrase [Paramicrobacterium sp. CJ85]|uniref:tyrosine-type recombinase/integrase n=1 Tax=Paramicrobacterium sp. CJ85 TaxID=3445355 RepID=UPI003F61C116